MLLLKHMRAMLPALGSRRDKNMKRNRQRQRKKHSKHRRGEKPQTRRMLVPTTAGQVPVSIRGSKEASRVGRYMAAVGKYLRTGDTEPLAEFAGQSIAGHSLITDPDTLNSLAEAGTLQLDSIYALSESSS